MRRAGRTARRRRRHARQVHDARAGSSTSSSPPGEDPSAFVGALLPGSLTGGPAATARWGAGPAFVVEADEYAGNFDPYRPAIAIITSVEWDHPDVFADEAAVAAAFERWSSCGRTPRRAPVLVANVGDAGAARLVERLADWPGRVVATCLVDGADAAAGRGRRSARSGPQPDRPGAPGTDHRGRSGRDELESCTAWTPGGPRRVRLPTAGRHNAANALGVAGAALALGVRRDRSSSGLAIVRGASAGGSSSRASAARRRRLRRLRPPPDGDPRDDPPRFGSASPAGRLWAVYEPLTFHRTAALLDAFARALAEADAVAIADIWAGRDPDTTVASAARLAAAVRGATPGHRRGGAGHASKRLRRGWPARSRPGDVVLVMGGGRSYRIGELLLEALEAG